MGTSSFSVTSVKVIQHNNMIQGIKSIQRDMLDNCWYNILISTDLIKILQ
jgi:hypothetical protein